MAKAILLLEDGTSFEGSCFGAETEAIGEVVFFTGVVGYQELITDPVYRGKIVCFSYPLIGNYGINDKGCESSSVQVSGIIAKENSLIYSNWQATGSLSAFMQKNKLVGLEDIDTRALVIHIRDHGEQLGIISIADFNKDNLLQKIKAAKGKKSKLISEVTPKQIETIAPTGKAKSRVAMLDLGAANSFIRSLSTQGIELVRMPAFSSSEEILKQEPDGILISSGPESMEELSAISLEVKKLLGKKPIFGNGAGHLVLAMALGAKVNKMKCGHHGVNHPVKHTATGKGEITSQAHSFVVESADKKHVAITHINVNDNSIEGIKSTQYPAFSVQFAQANFDEFIILMEGNKRYSANRKTGTG